MATGPHRKGTSNHRGVVCADTRSCDPAALAMPSAALVRARAFIVISPAATRRLVKCGPGPRGEARRKAHSCPAEPENPAASRWPRTSSAYQGKAPHRKKARAAVAAAATWSWPAPWRRRDQRPRHRSTSSRWPRPPRRADRPGQGFGERVRAGRGTQAAAEKAAAEKAAADKAAADAAAPRPPQTRPPPTRRPLTRQPPSGRREGPGRAPRPQLPANRDQQRQPIAPTTTPSASPTDPELRAGDRRLRLRPSPRGSSRPVSSAASTGSSSASPAGTSTPPTRRPAPTACRRHCRAADGLGGSGLAERRGHADPVGAVVHGQPLRLPLRRRVLLAVARLVLSNFAIPAERDFAVPNLSRLF